MTRFRGRANTLIAIALVAGLALGVGLIVTGGGSSSDDDAPASSTTVVEDDTSSTSSVPRASLPLDDLSLPALTELTGLVFPADMTEFLTARLDGDTQLDITFVMADTSTAAFLADSGLPAPVADERLVLHSSPLWKLNPEEGTTLSSTSGAFGQVERVVELLGDGTGTIRARIVVTAA